mmetsp:Transcript_9961/g.9826  ORF Transcript_9961/g.9826 Transcript_9961/m.9826 type:complete len:99 (+) Transcript_9961:800-1096(+)
MQEDFEESDPSLIKDEVKECKVCSIGSWIQTLLPINYDELMSSKKSRAKLTSHDYEFPNICCMDREEKHITMFMKRKDFKRFDFREGKIEEDNEFEPE